jgi:hypothetical protein
MLNLMSALTGIPMFDLSTMHPAYLEFETIEIRHVLNDSGSELSVDGRTEWIPYQVYT